MKVLVTGVNGQLGHDVVKRLGEMKIESIGVDFADFDITDETAVFGYVGDKMPDIIVHCAAYTNVNKAEEDLAKSYAVNVTGAENLARAANEYNAKILYVSTDYVFDGEKAEPYETYDLAFPLSQYGRTKLAGENAVRHACHDHFVVRTAWVFGKNGGNFVKTMLKLGAEKEEIGVVCDQIGSPTYTVDLAHLICDMISTSKYGTYHATNEGFCSWAEFAAEIMSVAKLPARIKPLTTQEYPSPAKRPASGRLSKRSLDIAGFKRLPDWRDALKRYINELNGE